MESLSLAAGVVGCIGAPDFAEAALKCISAVVPMGAWTVYHVYDGLPPEMELAATRGRADVTAACFDLYRRGLYKSDHSFDEARGLRPDDAAAVIRLQPSLLSNAHRARIYAEHQLQERLSLAACEGPGALFALNFYRFTGEPSFSDAEAQCFAACAPLLVAAVRRHLELLHGVRPPPTPRAADFSEIAIFRSRCPELTDRELEVCAGMVRGWTFDGIAAHLSVSAATVKTYRDRAFRRLGIKHRNQLYGMCVTGLKVRGSLS